MLVGACLQRVLYTRVSFGRRPKAAVERHRHDRPAHEIRPIHADLFDVGIQLLELGQARPERDDVGLLRRRTGDNAQKDHFEARE